MDTAGRTILEKKLNELVVELLASGSRILLGDVLERLGQGNHKNMTGPFVVEPCPRCQERGGIPPADRSRGWDYVSCKRCVGLGYLVTTQDLREDPEHDYTLDGRRAINAGDLWTKLDEAKALGYQSVGAFLEDGGDERILAKLP